MKVSVRMIVCIDIPDDTHRAQLSGTTLKALEQFGAVHISLEPDVPDVLVLSVIE